MSVNTFKFLAEKEKTYRKLSFAYHHISYFSYNFFYIIKHCLFACFGDIIDNFYPHSNSNEIKIS